MHLIISSDAYRGWEYGMLLCLEQEIIRQTGAERLVLEYSSWQRMVVRRFAHGTRYNLLRRFVPKRPLTLPQAAETVWLPLMGPENYSLDLFKPWTGNVRRVLYLFDTLPPQMPVTRRLFSGKGRDLRITSFNDAVPMLERETGQPWHHVDQAVSLSYFRAAPPAERVIHFSAYGRRHPKVHEAVRQFCAARGLYYDYTTHGRNDPTAGPLPLLEQFAWHLGHSLFTFCWPVEITNPERAGGLSPITCRWFEAAAAGAIVLGQPPRNPRFRELFGDGFVTPVNPEASLEALVHRLEQVWEQRTELSARALALRQKLGGRLDWAARVRQMLELVRSDGPAPNAG